MLTIYKGLVRSFMKYSTLFGKTSFGDVTGSKMPGHQLLVKGGFIRESVAGRYFLLKLFFVPLSWILCFKIKNNNNNNNK